MTRTSFHCGWYVGFIVRVVLWRASAFERVEEAVNVEGCWTGVLSIFAIIMEVSEVAGQAFRVSNLGGWEVNKDVRPAVIIFLCASFGRAGPTEPCCDRSAGGSCL